MGDLTTFETIIIAIVEGLTEFLPVSSYGTHDYNTKHTGSREYGICEGFYSYYPVWRDSFGCLPLLETVLPVEQHSGACRYFLAEAFAASVRFLLETVGCFYPCGYIGFLIQ